MIPKRVQMSRQRPWRAENPDAVIVARPSRWGNPFAVDVYGRELAIALYRQALSGGWSPSLLDQGQSDEYWDRTYALTGEFRNRLGGALGTASLARYELAGRDLACWCPLDVTCHADVLLEIANTPSASALPEEDRA